MKADGNIKKKQLKIVESELKMSSQLENMCWNSGMRAWAWKRLKVGDNACRVSADPKKSQKQSKMCSGDRFCTLLTLVVSVYALLPTVNRFRAPECIPECQHLFSSPTAHF